MANPILLTGCQRSGTTLLSLILDSHPEVSSVDEAIYDTFRLENYLSETDTSKVLFKLPTYTSDMQFIRDTPNLKVLWCKRDVKEVVASMLQLELPMGFNLPSVSWASHPHGAEKEIHGALIALAITGVTLDERTISNLKRFNMIKRKRYPLRNPEESSFAAALCWHFKNMVREAYETMGLDIHLVTYASLVEQPKDTLDKILRYLGLSWDDRLLEHHLLHSGVSVGNTENDRAIDAKSREKWKQVLDDKMLAAIDEVVG